MSADRPAGPGSPREEAERLALESRLPHHLPRKDLEQSVRDTLAAQRAADEAMRQQIEDQIERESYALFMTGKLYDDGIIDPRDTRSVLGMCLSAIDNGEINGTRGYGVFRM